MDETIRLALAFMWGADIQLEDAAKAVGVTLDEARAVYEQEELDFARYEDDAERAGHLNTDGPMTEFDS